VGEGEQHGRREEKEDGRGKGGRGTCRHAPSTCISAVPGQVEHASLGGLEWSNWKCERGVWEMADGLKRGVGRDRWDKYGQSMEKIGKEGQKMGESDLLSYYR
jgi:hypothetical protein